LGCLGGFGGFDCLGSFFVFFCDLISFESPNWTRTSSSSSSLSLSSIGIAVRRSLVLRRGAISSSSGAGCFIRDIYIDIYEYMR